MPKLYRKELSFQAGEITPRFYGRSETDVYEKGLAIAENVTIDKHGGAYKRGGLEHILRIEGDAARVFTLQVSRQRYYTLILHRNPLPTPQTPTELLIIAPGARLVGNNLLLNGNFVNAGDSWSTTVTPNTSRVSFTIGEATLLPEQNDVETVTDGLFSQGTSLWTERVVGGGSSVVGNVGEVILTAGQGGGGTRYAGIAQQLSTTTTGISHDIAIVGNFTSNLRVAVGTVEGDGTYLDINIQQAGSFSFTPIASPYWITLDCVRPDTVAIINQVSVIDKIKKTAAISQQATVTAAITDLHVAIIGQNKPDLIHVHIGTTEGASDIANISGTDLEIIATFVPNAATYWVTVLADGDETPEARITFVGSAVEAVVTGSGIQMDAPWTEDQLAEVHLIETPEGRVQYFTHPNVPVQRLFYDFANDFFAQLIPVTFLNPPVEWTGTNHPSTGTYFQGRLWLGGTPDQRETMWASVSGSPEDFDFIDDTIDPPAPTDATAFTVVLAEYGRLEWMLGTKNLLVGTENGEHIITSQGGVLTASDSWVEKQSSFGSNNMQAVQVGEKVFYLTPDGRKLRAMSYQWEEDNWLSQDLTFLSEHITLGIGIHRCWAQHPDNLFLLTLKDGTVAALTYDRTAQTVAWSHLTAPGMTVLDVKTGRDNGVNEIVLVGQRVTGFIDVETNSAQKEYLDSYVSVFDAGGTNVITGLDHLEGQTVRALVDGAVDPLQVVVGGQITTQLSGNQLFAGIPYSGKIKTLPIDSMKVGEQMRSFKKRWSKVWALMMDSKAPLINGIRPPDRTPSTPMDTVEPDSSEHFKTVGLGWDDFGQITIEQDLPVAMKVLAIYGEVSVETL